MSQIPVGGLCFKHQTMRLKVDPPLDSGSCPLLFLSAPDAELVSLPWLTDTLDFV